MTTTISTASAATMFVLLEGPSDVAAVAALMERDGLASPNVELVNLQGATNVGRVLGEIRQIRSDADVVGLCDAADTRAAEKALADDGLPVLDASDLPVYGFFVCEPDLEGELIRALGAERAKAAIEGAGLGSKFDALRTGCVGRRTARGSAAPVRARRVRSQGERGRCARRGARRRRGARAARDAARPDQVRLSAAASGSPSSAVMT